MSRQYRFDCPGHGYLSDVDPCPQCAAADPGPPWKTIKELTDAQQLRRSREPPIPRKVWIVTEEEPDDAEFPSVVLAVYDNEQAANDHVDALRDENGLADDDEYADADISWLVEGHTLHSTAQVLTVEDRAMARHRMGES